MALAKAKRILEITQKRQFRLLEQLSDELLERFDGPAGVARLARELYEETHSPSARVNILKMVYGLMLEHAKAIRSEEELTVSVSALTESELAELESKITTDLVEQLISEEPSSEALEVANE